MINKELLEKTIGYTLPNDLFVKIPFDSGLFPKQNEIVEKNKFYVDWGHPIAVNILKNKFIKKII